MGRCIWGVIQYPAWWKELGINIRLFSWKGIFSRLGGLYHMKDIQSKKMSKNVLPNAIHSTVDMTCKSIFELCSITYDILTCSGKWGACWCFGKMLSAPTPAMSCFPYSPTEICLLIKVISFSGLTFGDSTGWKPWSICSRLMRRRIFCPALPWAIRSWYLFHHLQVCGSSFGSPYLAGRKQAQF